MGFEGLPEDVMTLILAKLPVKSLMRFKCVRKSWYSLIKSPQFIHLHRSSPSSPSNPLNHCFIIRRVKRCVEEPRHVLSFYSYETLDDLGNDINMPISDHNDINMTISDHDDQILVRPLRGRCPFGHWGDVLLSGSCGGLVCLTNHNDQILICNPAIREFRPLFVPKRSGYHIDSVAFGTDPNTGHYKVVMIGVACDNSHPHDEDDYGDREALVYDFSTDSWRETGVVIPAPFRYSRLSVALNGAFHWSPWDDDSNILTFHISDEVTESIPLPDFVGFSTNKELFVSSKSQLALVLCDFGRLDICVMTEYGVKESWTRLFLIERLHCYPLAFWDDQQLLLQNSDRQLISCDLQHRAIRHFPIYGEMNVYPYSENLVSVNGIGECIF